MNVQSLIPIITNKQPFQDHLAGMILPSPRDRPLHFITYLQDTLSHIG